MPIGLSDANSKILDSEYNEVLTIPLKCQEGLKESLKLELL